MVHQFDALITLVPTQSEAFVYYAGMTVCELTLTYTVSVNKQVLQIKLHNQPVRTLHTGYLLHDSS